MSESHPPVSQQRANLSCIVSHDACSKDPWSGEAHLDEAMALEQAGRLGEAVSGYLAASMLMPALSAAKQRLDAALGAYSLTHGGVTDASVHLVQKLRVSSEDAAAFVALARMEQQQGRCRARAVVYFESALRLNPNTDVRRELAQTLWDLGHKGRAKQQVVDALERDPTDAKLLRLVAQWSVSEHDWSAAERYSRRLVALPGQDGTTLVHLGTAVRQLRHPVEAAEILERAIELNSNLLEAYISLSAALVDQGDFERANRVCRRGLALEPNCAALISRLLFLLHFDPEASAESIFAEHCVLARRLAHPNDVALRRFSQSRERARTLRVGYVSPHFDSHAVAYCLEPILMAHDPSAVQVFLYSDVAHPDATTERLRRLAFQFTSVVGWSDVQVANRIATDEVDILVDLAGHTERNRLPVFSRKPSPIQASWLGYFDTTGLDTIDYHITDEYAVPIGAERLFVEKVQRLAHSAICYLAPERPVPGQPPCLERNDVTFGCFDDPVRITRNVVGVFCRILREVPNSRLVLKHETFEDVELRQQFRRVFAREGIDEARVEILAGPQLGDDLNALSEVDVALSSFPYGDETSALHALWMGVPIVALEGTGLGQRGASRVLRISDHAAWIAGSLDQYVSVAKQLAADKTELARLRLVTRSTLEVSSLMDYAGLTRALEAAYRRMWCDWCEQNDSEV